MNNWLKKGVSLSLLVVLWASTTGLNVFSHLCTSSGYNEVSVKEVESCCAAKKSVSSDANLTDDCCSNNHLLLRLESPYSASEDLVIEHSVAFITFPLSSEVTIQQQQVLFAVSLRPPPDDGMTGHQMLVANQVFLI